MTAKKKATRRKLIPNRDAKVLDEANVTKIGTFGNSDRAQELRSETVKFPFKRDGFLHELISKDGSVCLVRRSKGNRQTHFEVVVLQWSNGRTWPYQPRRLALSIERTVGNLRLDVPRLGRS